MKDLPTEGVRSGFYDSVTNKDCPVLKVVDINDHSPLGKLGTLLFTEDRTGLLVSLIAPYKAEDMTFGATTLYGVQLLEDNMDAIEPVVLDEPPSASGLFWNYRYFARNMGLSPRGLFALIKKAAPRSAEDWAWRFVTKTLEEAESQ